MDLPGGGAGKRREPLPKLAHVPLFSEKIVAAALQQTELVNPSPEAVKAAVTYAKLARSAKFQGRNEVQAAPDFINLILKQVLGFQSHALEDKGVSLKEQFRLGGKPVDVALGRFDADDTPDLALAPLEMKGPDTPDLDRIMAGRGLSPVQQAWDYAADAPDAKWVMVSNCLELRLYRLGRGRETHERFDLTRLDEPEQLRRFLAILDANRFLGGRTDDLLSRSDGALKDITDTLYQEYAGLRGKLLAFLRDSADGPGFATKQAIEATQKLLDRVLFIAFASGNRMLPEKLFLDALSIRNDFDPKPLWHNVQRMFQWIDKGNDRGGDRFNVWPYNGGLFAPDPLVDDLMLPDHLAEEFKLLLGYDYGKDVSVNVLGHIFEQSISDLEKLRDDQPDDKKVSQRKRDGVVYTPEHVTRFLVQKTIGVTLDERRAAVLARHGGLAKLPSDKDEVEWPEEAQRAFWQEWHGVLQSLTILDPACGSGAFLVAAFEYLTDEYRRTVERLAELDVAMEPGYDIFDDILSRNIYGVDLNVESVEIARLALWLKSARRQKRLAKLDAMVQAGDSLIDDPKASSRAFNWREAFPDVMAQGGFDIVLGNPPYVRMELIKPLKPWLAKHYTVADERTDLYAYFFEQGVRLLKKGGRLGFISSSTFFRTGSGERLRLFLNEYTDIETVIDFGDGQVFEGVTTYAAILTMRKRRTPDEPLGPPEGDLAYLTFKDDAPMDLGRAFDAFAKTMPRARLTGGSWQLENEALAKLRAKIIGGRKTLKEVYGAPLYGIKTGLNEAFVIDTPTRDRLVKADPKSAELLKPFLKGENIKRWRVEPEGLWLINTPKGKVDIERYPAIRDWLLPFKDRLLARATEQEWWELQQAQLAYQPVFEGPKIIYMDICNSNTFAIDIQAYQPANTCYLIQSSDQVLVAFLNSKIAWFYWSATTNIARGGYLRLRSEFLEGTPLPFFQTASAGKRVDELGARCAARKADLASIQTAFHTRVLNDLAAPGTKLNGKLKAFHTLTFKELQAEIKKALKAEIPVKERGQWQALHEEASAEIKRLEAEIAAAEAEINRLVYEAFELTPDEIALLEASLEGQV
ncbi:MAG: N-6 DNA methylase [Rhizobiaceae bacterium]|nr:N-6 DNA methylase [Rhizobiaceae bacterium]